MSSPSHSQEGGPDNWLDGAKCRWAKHTKDERKIVEKPYAGTQTYGRLVSLQSGRALVESLDGVVTAVHYSDLGQIDLELVIDRRELFGPFNEDSDGDE